jgi:hypothetical protein
MSTSSSSDRSEDPLEEPREARFTLTLDDLAAFRLYDTLHGSSAGRGLLSGRYFLVVSGVFFLLVSVSLAWGIVPRVGWVRGLFVPLAVAVPTIPLGYYFYKSAADPNRKSHRSALEKATRDLLQRQYDHGELDKQLGGQRLELTSRGLVLETDFQTSVTPWSGVEKIVTTESHAFFYHSQYAAHVLPIQAFGSAAEFTAFVETARALKEAACRPGTADTRPEEALGEVSRQPGGVIEVAYKHTLEDNLAYLRVISMRERWSMGGSPSGLLLSTVAATWFVIGGWVMVALVLKVAPKEAPVVLLLPALLLLLLLSFVWLALLFIVLSVVFPPLTLLLAKNIGPKHWRPYYEATHRLRLTPDNLIQAAGDRVTARPWDTVEQIVSTPDHAFFRVSRTEVLPLPRWAFAREADFTDFVETAQKYHQSARRS